MNLLGWTSQPEKALKFKSFGAARARAHEISSEVVIRLRSVSSTNRNRSMERPKLEWCGRWTGLPTEMSRWP
jgi:hypothetical protein